jgi:regulator of cell morphogenesis and NO signaling
MTNVHHQSIGDIVAAKPAAAKLFGVYGIDFCCHGDRTLADACAAAGVEPSTVAVALDELPPDGVAVATWVSLSPPELAAHIVDVHHRYLAALELDTHVHIHKENHMLFPAARRMAG